MRLLLCLLLACVLLPMVPASSQQRPSATFEEDFWNGVKDSGVPQAIVDYIWLFPDGRFVDEANAEIERLRAQKGQVTLKDHGGDELQASGGRNKPDPAPKAQQIPKKAEPPAIPTPDNGRKLSVLPIPTPDDTMPTCAERFAAQGPAAERALCVTFIESGNFQFSRDCQPHSFGFAGVSVSEEAFFSAGDTLLLRATDTDNIQTWSDRPHCYEIAEGKPEKLRRFRHLMVEVRDTTAQVCDAKGKCF